MTQVVAALIWDKKRFLICQRPEGKARALKWEYVGGKVEIGETLEDALIRECFEELGIKISVGDIFYEVDHYYSDISIHLTLFNAEIIGGRPALLEHKSLKWILPSEIKNYDFCPADEEINNEIIKKFLRG